jgi:hypothetical protein
MRQLTAAGDRLGQARDLAPLLDAAYDAFEEILAVISDHEDAADTPAVPLLLAATQTANARDAVLFAPSLPTRRLHQAQRVGEEPERGSAHDITAAVAGLCRLLASRLAHTAGTAATAGDQAACQDAAHHAQAAHALLTGSGP